MTAPDLRALKSSIVAAVMDELSMEAPAESEYGRATARLIDHAFNRAGVDLPKSTPDGLLGVYSSRVWNPPVRDELRIAGFCYNFENPGRPFHFQPGIAGSVMGCVSPCSGR